MDNPKMIEWRSRKSADSVNGMVEVSVLGEGDTFRKGDNLFMVTDCDSNNNFVTTVICLTGNNRSCRYIPSDCFVHQVNIKFKEV